MVADEEQVKSIALMSEDDAQLKTNAEFVKPLAEFSQAEMEVRLAEGCVKRIKGVLNLLFLQRRQGMLGPLIARSRN